MSAPKMLLPVEYVRDATKAIEHAKKRVVFLAMVAFEDEESTSLINAMVEAAKRGVKVEVAADILTYTESAGTTFPIRYFDKKSSRATNTRRKLLKSGAKFHWLGRSHMTLYSGRTHSKWCVVDDTVYTFGGVNLFHGGVTNNDYMFKFTNQKIADAIDKEHQRYKQADRREIAYRSHALPTEFGTVLFDGGLVGESIIYRRATALAQLAQRITLVSQYSPTGKLARALRDKNKQVELYFNPPQNATLLNRALIQFGMWTSHVSTLYQKRQYLHAKFIIFEMLDGSKVAITGSHNFNHTGVVFGTREIALETKDPAIITQLEQFFQEHVLARPGTHE